MNRYVRLLLSALLLMVLPLTAAAIVEKKTEVEYPDLITAGCGGQQVELAVTGAGLREKTFMKVDVYTIVSYVVVDANLGDDAAAGLVNLDAPKRLQMDLRRGFSREKLINSFVESIEKNVEDTGPIAEEIETFKAYFERDAQDGDRILFDYCPATGLTTTLNGELRGTIADKDFASALWTVWFGEKPASGGLKKALLGQDD